MMIMIKLFILILPVYIILNPKLYGQSTGDDCAIYQSVLIYLNEKEASVHSDNIYVYPVDPKSDLQKGKYIERSGYHQNNFLIVKEMNTEFGYESVRDWFSHLMNDKTIIQKDYFSNNDSFVNCEFGCGIKYQIKPFGVRIAEGDFLHEKIGDVEKYYHGLRITFSRIIYTKDNRALLFVALRSGIGGGRDTYILGFVFYKSNTVWAIDSVNGESR